VDESGGVSGTALRLRPAQASEFDRVVALLERAGLPTRDLSPASLTDFVVAADAEGLAGAVALVRDGDVALLRSLVVAADRRGRGIGGALVDAVEQRAHACGVTSIFLLTETAQRFFEGQGYAVVERAAAPAAIRASTEFASLCPASAVLMRKLLA
jgi:amino-acid N-acetyltransferase